MPFMTVVGEDVTLGGTQDGLDHDAGDRGHEPMRPCVSCSSRFDFAGDSRVLVLIPQSTRSGNGVIVEER